MSRALTNDMQTAVAAERGDLFHFMQFSFQDAETYLCTAPHDVSWNSQSWIGIGGNIGFESVEEGTDLGGQGINVILAGVDQSVISLILTKKYIGRYCRIWLAHGNESGAIIADPVRIFWGRMNGGFQVDETREDDQPGTVTIRGRMVDRLGDLHLVRGIQTNVESHQKYFSGDQFFSFTAEMMTKKVVWGKSKK